MSDYILTHHGIKGQKWGQRRFQNYDGTLTSAGKQRYGNNSRYTDEYKDFLETGTTPYIPGVMESYEDADEYGAGALGYMLDMYFAAYDDDISQEQSDSLIQDALANLSYGMNALKNPKVESALHRKMTQVSDLISNGLDKVEDAVGSVFDKFRKPKDPVVLSPHMRKPKAREKNVGKKTGEIKIRKPTKEERKKIGNVPVRFN